MEIYLFVTLGIASIVGVVFLIFFKLQDRKKHIH